MPAAGDATGEAFRGGIVLKNLLNEKSPASLDCGGVYLRSFRLSIGLSG